MPSLTRRHASPGKNERRYPHIVELAVGKRGLDIGLNRRIMDFHNSRHIKLRHGHIVLKEGQNVLSLVFFGINDGPRSCAIWIDKQIRDYLVTAVSALCRKTNARPQLAVVMTAGRALSAS